MSRSVSVPALLPPVLATREPAIPPGATTGPSRSGTGRRPEDRQHRDDRIAVLARPDNSRMQVGFHAAADECTVTVSGEIDCLTAPGLQQALLDVLDGPHPPGGVVVDLRRVTFLDAAGLTALAVGHHRAEQTGGVLRIRCGTVRAVIRLLQITGLWETLHVVQRESADDSC